MRGRERRQESSSAEPTSSTKTGLTLVERVTYSFVSNQLLKHKAPHATHREAEANMDVDMCIKIYSWGL